MIKRRKKKTVKTHSVQLTALVDAFTILLVFFLVQFSNTTDKIKQEKNVELPITSYSQPIVTETLVPIAISANQVMLDDQVIAKLSRGTFLRADLSKKDSDFVETIYQELSKQEDFKEKTGHTWVLQPDKAVPYKTLRKIIYTLAISGITDIKLASISGN